LLAMVTFLGLNGHELDITDAEIVAEILVGARRGRSCSPATNAM